MILQLRSYRKIQKRSKITPGSLQIPTTPTSRTSRWRAAAAAPLTPWIGASPPAVGKSPDNGTEAPTPWTAVVAAQLRIITFLFKLHHPDPPPMQIRRGLQGPRHGSDEPPARGGPALRSSAPQSTTTRGDERRLLPPHRRRHRLHSAAGR